MEDDTRPLVDVQESLDINVVETDTTGSATTTNESRYVVSSSTGHLSGDSDSSTIYTSQLAALLIIINVTIGVGALAMPSKMQESGVIPALLLQIPFLVAIIVTTIMCTEMTVKKKVNSYHAMVEAHSNRTFYIISQVSLLSIVFGTMAAFIVIIGDQSDSLFFSLYKDTYCQHPWYMNRNFIVIIATTCFIIPLCSAKTVDFLKYASILGILSIGFILYMVLEQCYKQYSNNSSKTDWWAEGINWWPKKWQNAPLILPVYCIAYQCHLSWVPTVATTRREEKYTTYKTISIAMIISAFIYSMVCVVALLACGALIEPDLTASFNFRKDWVVEGTIAIVALKCIFTLPAAFLPARISVIERLEARFEWFANLSEPTRRIGVTCGMILLALATALISKKIQVVVGILGCLSVLFIFPLPAICYLDSVNENRRYKQQLEGDTSPELKYTAKDKAKRYLSFFFIVFGFIMMALVLYTAINDIISPQNGPEVDPCKPTNGTNTVSLFPHRNYGIILG